MKRIRKIISASLTLMMSILVMCVGVYAAASAPKVGVSGTISYDAGACKVRVIGNLSGAYTDTNGSGTTAVAKTVTDNNSQPCHYYGVHDNAQSATNMLPAWNIGSVYFKERASGAETFVISLKVENLSAYPIKATVNTTATEVADNITKTIENNGAEIAVGGNAEILVKYDVTDSSQATTLTIGNELVFEKSAPSFTMTVIVDDPTDAGIEGGTLNGFAIYLNDSSTAVTTEATTINLPQGSKVKIEIDKSGFQSFSSGVNLTGVEYTDETSGNIRTLTIESLNSDCTLTISLGQDVPF